MFHENDACFSKLKRLEINNFAQQSLARVEIKMFFFVKILPSIKLGFPKKPKFNVIIVPTLP